MNILFRVTMNTDESLAEKEEKITKMKLSKNKRKLKKVSEKELKVNDNEEEGEEEVNSCIVLAHHH